MNSMFKSFFEPRAAACVFAAMACGTSHASYADQYKQDTNSRNDLLELVVRNMIGDSRYIVRSHGAISKSSFAIIYDSKTRCPTCTIERLSASDFQSKSELEQLSNNNNGKVVKSGKNRPAFFAEVSIKDDSFKISPKDYNDSRFDRGHMIPAADFSHDDELYTQTFTMANICPQAPLLNRGVWGRLEAWVRHYLLRYHFEDMIVITGPVFAPIFYQGSWLYLHRTIGTFPKLVTVPSHFYKILIGRPKDKKGKWVIAAFMVPNHNQVSATEPVNHYLVQLNQLESIVGYTFLPTILSEKTKEALDNSNHIPDFRDLSVVLNANYLLISSSNNDSDNINHSNKSSNKNNHSLNFIDSMTHPDRPIAIDSRSKEGKNSSTKKSNSSSYGGNNSGEFIHLCAFPDIDCSKCMFPSSSSSSSHRTQQ